MNKKLILLLLIFFIIQLPIVFFTSIPSDGMVYYLTSREVSKGNELYTEIFFSHPPLQIWLYTILIKLFGFHIFVLKGFTLLVSIGCCIMIYLICKEKYGEKVGLISFFLFMTSYNALFASFSFGIELSVLFFLISFYFLNKNNYLSGLFFALCVMFRLHLGFLGIVLFLFSKEKRKFLFGVSLSIIYYGLLFRLVPESIPQMLSYHISKLYFLKGWFTYLKTTIHLLVLFFFSIKWIKDIKLVFIGATYLLFLLLVHSIFHYYFLLVTIILCIEGSNALVHSKQKKSLWIMVFLFIFLLVLMAVPFLYKNTKGYNEFADYIETLEDKPMVGQSAITALIAIKTDRNISKYQIDTNLQRREIYDYSNAIVVYEREIFTGYLFNCTLLRDISVEKKNYRVWNC